MSTHHQDQDLNLMLVRHGQASFGSANYDQLSKTGYKQAAALGHWHNDFVSPEALSVHGGLQRHIQTMDGYWQARGIEKPVIHSDPDWSEYDYKDLLRVYEPRYEDQMELMADLARAAVPPKIRFQEIFNDAVQTWVDGQRDGYVESFDVFMERCQRAFAQTAERLAERHSVGESSSTGLVFTSGGPVAAVVGAQLGLNGTQWKELTWVLANTSVTTLKRVDGQWRLVSLNERGSMRRDASLLTYR